METTYECLVEYRQRNKSYIHYCWVQAQSVGQAIAYVEAEAKTKRRQDFLICELNSCQEELVPVVFENEMQVVYFEERHEYDDDEDVLRLPVGVIASSDEDSDIDFSALQCGYERSRYRNVDSLLINANQEDLAEIFDSLLKIIGPVEKIRLEVSPDWDTECKSRQWECELVELNKRGLELRSFLKRFNAEIFENGYVSLSLCNKDSELTLNDHKQLELHTSQPQVLEQSLFLSRRYKLPLFSQLLCLGEIFPHLHYVSPKARTSRTFYKSLEQAGFKASPLATDSNKPAKFS